jgi:hypothetical protein
MPDGGRVLSASLVSIMFAKALVIHFFPYLHPALD